MSGGLRTTAIKSHPSSIVPPLGLLGFRKIQSFKFLSHCTLVPVYPVRLGTGDSPICLSTGMEENALCLSCTCLFLCHLTGTLGILSFACFVLPGYLWLAFEYTCFSCLLKENIPSSKLPLDTTKPPLSSFLCTVLQFSAALPSHVSSVRISAGWPGGSAP